MAQMFVNGEWTSARSGDTYEVRNPANGEMIDSVPSGNEEDAAAVESAAAAFKDWAATGQSVL